MEIFSRGSFYLGIEDTKYCDISIHLGNFRLEYDCKNPLKQSESSTETDNGPPSP